MARNHARHVRHKLERAYGPGLQRLFHPVTHEFNHAAVIERRGGRHPEEYITTEKTLGIHQAFAWIHGLYGDTYPDKNRKKHVKVHPKVRQDDFDFSADSGEAPAEEAPKEEGSGDASEAPKEEDSYPKLWMKLGDHLID